LDSFFFQKRYHFFCAGGLDLNWSNRLIGLPALRLALVGRPGAGKSTAAKFITEWAEQTGKTSQTCSIAGPLYDMQQAFRSRLGRSESSSSQDGSLLNFFGSHFRMVEPEFLMQDFQRRLCVQYLDARPDLIVCDDARPLDIETLRMLGFTFILVEAPDELRLSRKAQRADETNGDDGHITERGLEDLAPDFRLQNSANLSDFQSMIADTLNQLFSSKRGTVSIEQAWTGILDEMVSFVWEMLSAYISRHYVESKHQIGSMIVSASGQIYFGLHVEAMVGRASSCAENGALAKFCEAEGASGKAVMVASMRWPKPSERQGSEKLVPPCGICREILADYLGDSLVLLGTREAIGVRRLLDLIPEKYQGTKWLLHGTGNGFARQGPDP
jgi:cytidine deaminase